MQTIGFIDYFLDEWHANNYPEWINRRPAGSFKWRTPMGKSTVLGRAA